MKISLGKSYKKDHQVTVLSTSEESPAIKPEYLDPETHKAIDTFMKGKKNNAIKAWCLSFVKGKDIQHLIICSTGNKPWSNYQMDKWVKAVLNSINATDAKKINIDVEGLMQASKATDTQKLIANLSQLLLHHQYSFNQYKSTASKRKKDDLSINLFGIHSDRDLKNQIELSKDIDEGKTLARNLANMPANDCNVKHLVEVASKLARNNKVKMATIGERQMKKLGMGAFLAVTRGSSQEGKIIILEYHGAGTNDPYHALIGKGLTFDTGGISLKPAGGMEEMKYDMCGAASVLGCCQAIISNKAKVNAIFVVAAAENMPSGDATRPGDIVTSHAGLTVEVLNTDAEGRLVLCDTISYIKKRYNPATIVDIATLTGACVVALGHHASALYSNNNKLLKRLENASNNSGDSVWPMPLWQEYQDQLSSNIADLPNISGGRDAGSVTAACFLSRFAEGTDWAHLDIAGTGWQSGKNKQATGRPTGLLTHYLLGQND